MISKQDLLICFLFIIIGIFLTTFRLAWGSLEPWDEAWYADIGRGVAQGKVVFLEAFDKPFYDHPPLGYWLIGLSMLVWGETTFAPRVVMALIGVAGVVSIYFLGKKLHNRWTGILAAILLLTSRWFLLRSRTGNLDSLLTLTQILTIYWAFVAQKSNQFRWSWVFLALSLLSKSVISLCLLPLLLFKTWNLWVSKKLSLSQMVVLFLLAFGPISAWYLINYLEYGYIVIYRSIIFVGLREGAAGGFSLDGLSQFMMTLQAIVHRWFKLFLLTLPLSLVFLSQRSVRWILAYLFLVALPFLISSEERIWHLIPLTPPIALVISLTITLVIASVSKYLSKKVWFAKESYLYIFVNLVVLFLAFISIFEMLPEIFRSTNKPSDQQVLGTAVMHLPGPLVLDTFQDVGAAAGYYADRQIIYVPTGIKNTVISDTSRPFVLYTGYNSVFPENCDSVASSSGSVALFCK